MKKLAAWLGLLLLTAGNCPGQAPFQPVTPVDAPSIQGRAVELDARGQLLPWPRPADTGYSYEAYFISRWQYLWEQYNHERFYEFYCCVNYSRQTFATYPDLHWANSTGYLRAMMEGFVEHLYPYTADTRTLSFLEELVDYELENGTTPSGYVWSGVPYASADPGARRYSGWRVHGIDYIEPPVVGADGFAYLRLYEMTGKTRYLAAAIRCANALAKNYREGDAMHSPWPYRCYARDGRVEGKEMGAYSADVIEPIALFDELIRLNFGDAADYRRIRNDAWAWLREYPMKNNVWVGYFEDVTPSMANMNNVIPLETARYVILHTEFDPDWRQDAARLIEWVKTTPKWPKYIVHGATVTTEQGDGVNFCCQKPNWCCDSHTARLAAVEALYFAKTGDAAYRDRAFRSFNWVTYFQGFPPAGETPWGQDQWWFTDEFSDGPRRLMDGFWAVPEWAPADESHFLGSTSVVTRISYDQGAVAYSTFDADSTDVLRLDFVPKSVAAGGRELSPRQDLNAEGFTFDPATHVLKVHHVHAQDISVVGDGGNAPAQIVDFDNPYLPAGTILRGQYPSGVIQWGDDGEWRIGVPAGRLATFNLGVSDPQTRQAGFEFDAPRLLAGVDVYNRGSSEITFKIHSPTNPDFTGIIPAGELVRLTTGWRNSTSRISFEAEGGAALGNLLFDNLAFVAITPAAGP
ncbi:MAG TPA: hypothetical protein VL523_18735 [Terriglobia bacterium]|nr:hypothetical protein [Terriglobia bacterium]